MRKRCHVMSRYVASCHVISRHVTSCHVTLCHVMPRDVPHVTSCHAMSRHVISRNVMSRHVMSRHVTSCPVMSRHVTSCYVISLRKSRDGHTTNTLLSTDFFHTQSIQIKHDRVCWLSRSLPIPYRISGIWSSYKWSWISLIFNYTQTPYGIFIYSFEQVPLPINHPKNIIYRGAKN